MLDVCYLCPRKCGVNRDIKLGSCGVGKVPLVARAAAHFGEEPCISGTRGAGAVFFSGCNLGCIYCQNRGISRGQTGTPTDANGLARIYRKLIMQGVHNIDLVTPLHYLDEIERSLHEPLPVPVIINTGGYDSVDAIDRLRGKVQVYLPDYKYSEPDVARKYSRAADYPGIALNAIRAMLDAVGTPVFNHEGMLVRGVLIRHMVIPGELDNTYGCIEAVAGLPRGSVLFSLMSQYTPVVHNIQYNNLNRRVTEEEYAKATSYARLCGIKHGYFQDKSSATKEEIPSFDLTGTLRKEDNL